MKPSPGILVLIAALWMPPCMAFADGGNLDFSCVARKVDQKTTTSTPAKSNDGSSSGPSYTFTKEDWQYVVTLQNNDPFKDLANIEVKYIIFFKQEELGTVAGARLARQAGSAKIDDIKAGDKATFDTVAVKLQKASLGGGYSYKNGGKTDAEGNLAGLWIRIYQNGNLVAEMSRPANLLTKEKWDE